MTELHAKDLNKEAPRSPFARIAGFSILARSIDKCRATIAGTADGYHYNCPLDRILFDFKGIDADELKTYIADGRSDEEIGEWIKEHGTPKTDEEIAAWSDDVDQTSYYDKPEKRDWFVGECQRLGIDPQATSLFQYLDVDDKDCHKG